MYKHMLSTVVNATVTSVCTQYTLVTPLTCLALVTLHDKLNRPAAIQTSVALVASYYIFTDESTVFVILLTLLVIHNAHMLPLFREGIFQKH